MKFKLLSAAALLAAFGMVSIGKVPSVLAASASLTALDPDKDGSVDLALDVICVPGGSTGTLAAMEAAETIAFLKDRGSRARYVTSVCTGSLVLGAAGLLRGYKATSHWVTRDILKEFGAEPVDQRVVIDRNRITGAGVTAGLDMGLTLVAKMRDRAYAESLQLLAEYAPEPPFNAGSRKTAPKEAIAMIEPMFTQFVETARQVAKNAVGRL